MTPPSLIRNPIPHLCLILCPLLFLFSCSSHPNPIPKLTPPDLQDGETSVYTVRRNDSLLFRRTITATFDEEAGEPITIFTSVVQSESTAYYFFDSTSFALTRYTLIPLWLSRTIASEISITETEVTFETDNIRLEKTTIEGTSEIYLKPTPRAYCVEMLPLLLRAIPLEPALNFTINAIITIELRTLPVQVRVLGTKMMTTPLGEILCREVETSSQGRTIRLVYELNPPNRLIAIRDLENSTETVLNDFYIQQTTPGLPLD